MTARCIPEQPAFASDAERCVWERLREQLPDEAVLFANRRFTDRDGDCEADLLIAWPEVGVVVVEVKGGHVALDTDGRWHQSDRHDDREVDPVWQAQRSRYALRAYLDQHPGWSGGHVRSQHLVAFPFTRVPDDAVTTDCPRWRVLGRGDLDHAARHVAAGVHEVGHERVPEAADIERLVGCLVGRGASQRELLAGQVAARDAHVDLLTEQQSRVLDAISVVPRVEVRGGAGSGKTWLAVEKARRLAKDRKRVALLSYSRGLAMYLRLRCEQLPARQRPAYVGTFHELGLSWGAERGADDDPTYWEDRLPRAMTALAADLPLEQRFDAVVVDEGQDFDDSWWQAVVTSLRDPDHGELVVFADEGQRVFARQGRAPVELVPISLDENLRNTKQIAQTFSSLVPTQQRIRGGAGADVRFVSCAADDALAVADALVDELLEEVGYEPEHIALLTTGRRHPVQVEGQEEGQDVYWQDFFAARSTFYGHVLGFKGLERPVVVLAVNGFGSGDGADRAREKLYVGLSRARDLLVVCGDPDVIREAGGEGVARRLGIR